MICSLSASESACFGQYEVRRHRLRKAVFGKRVVHMPTSGAVHNIEPGLLVSRPLFARGADYVGYALYAARGTLGLCNFGLVGFGHDLLPKLLLTS